MKNIMKKMLLIFALMIFTNKVYAFSSVLTPSSTIIKSGENVTIKLNVSGLTNGLGSFNYSVGYDSSLFTYVSNSTDYGLTLNTDVNPIKFGFADLTTNNPISNGNVINFTFKSKSVLTDKLGSFTITASGLRDKDGNTITSTNTGTSVKVHVISTVNTLSNLTLSSGSLSPSFSSDVLSYTATVNSSSVTISAAKTDSNSTISGLGTKSLSYGSNKVSVIVTSESGVKKTYVINITRPDTREDVSTLSKLSIDGYTLSPTFDKDKTSYTLTVDGDVSKIKINATKTSSKSSFVTNYGPREVKLNSGENKILIKVKSEKGNIKTYTITVTKTDSRDTNNYLSTLSLDCGSIDFNKETNKYSLIVGNDVSKATIAATLESEKASFVKNYGPRIVELKNDTNTVLVKVMSESEKINTYEITINKKDLRSTDSSLSGIELSAGNIIFDANTLNYEVKVNNLVKTIKITPTTSNTSAKYEITGPDELSLGSNVYKIIVTAQNNTSTTYTINVIRSDEVLSNNANVKNITIKDVDFKFDKNTYNYTIKTNLTKLDITVEPEDSNAVYSIIGNENLENDSVVRIAVAAEDGSNQNDYIITIKNKNKILMGVIFASLTIILFILFIVLYLKRTISNKNKKATN